MGAAFDRWLARPSTICLLRRILSTVEEPEIWQHRQPLFRNRNRRQQRRVATAVLRSDKEHFPQSSLPHPGTRASSHQSAPRNQTTLTGLSAGELHREIDVNSESPIVKLFVDLPKNRYNTKLWTEILSHQQRLNGLNGVWNVWQGLRTRGLDLPTVGDEAHILWTSFIRASISQDRGQRYRELYDAILDYARDLKARRGLQYELLVPCIISHWIRVKPELARQWYKKLTIEFEVPQSFLHDLASDFAASHNQAEARKCFRRIHTLRRESGLYDRYMPEILKRQDEITSLQWHRELLSTGDGPNQDLFGKPQVQRLFGLDEDLSLPMIHKSSRPLTAHMTHSTETPDGFPTLTRADMSMLVGNVHGIKARDVSDGFIAKIFATQTFSLDLIVRGMGFFGVETLGPLSIRELAIRAKSPSEFGSKLAELEMSGIRPDNSVYSRLLRKLASSHEPKLFHALISSDQHPEEYSDGAMQETLLNSYLKENRWEQAHVTLVALSLLGATQQSRAWNRLLQHYIVSQHEQSILLVMQHIQASKLLISRRSLTFMHRYILPKRLPGKRPDTSKSGVQPLIPLDFTTVSYIYAAQVGTSVNPSLWVENLKRYGMAGDWDSVKHLVLWLVTWYSKEINPQQFSISGRRVQRTGLLRQILDLQMRQAIITWGFRCAAKKGQLRSRPPTSDVAGPEVQGAAPIRKDECEPWAQGLMLLKRLDDLGVRTHPSEIRRTFVRLMWNLFGPAYSTLKANHMARTQNQLTLAQYVRHANEIWKGKLFDFNPVLLDNTPDSHSKLLIGLFGFERRVSKSRDEYADVASFAYSDFGRISHAPRGMVHESLRWHDSPERLFGRRGPSRSAHIIQPHRFKAHPRRLPPSAH